MKRQNPKFDCLKIAQEIAHAFGVEINKDVVRRILEKHYGPTSNNDGPSWLTTLGHIKDSLWSMDLFRCESIWLQSCGSSTSSRVASKGSLPGMRLPMRKNVACAS